jgi:VCBS repeat-containing protein
MPAGTLTLHDNIGSVVSLAALTRVSSGNPAEAVYETTGSPPLRLVFTLDPLDPDAATSFIVTDASGTATYAEGDYGVSLTNLDLALLAGSTAGALAALLGELATIALGADADVDLATFAGGYALAGNDLGTVFTVSHGAGTSVDAGGGDDEIILTADTSDGGLLDGGEGNDTLSLIASTAQVVVYVASRVIGLSAGSEMVFRAFENIESFRGTSGNELFFSTGEGFRYEGGAGEDQFFLDSGQALADVVDYSREAGGSGIVANLEITMDPADLSGLAADLAAAFATALEGDPWLPGNYVRDTFGHLDYVGAGFVIVGTDLADFFYGSGGADSIEGGGGDDHFFGGDGDDTFAGGDGADVFYLSLDQASYEIVAGGSGVFTITGGGATDVISGVETISFAGTQVSTASLAPAGPVATDDVNGADLVVEAGADVAGDAGAAGNVLSNDDDPNDDPITVTGIRSGSTGEFTAISGATVVAGTYGTLTISANGSWSYALDDVAANALSAGAVAHDVFAYRASDGTLDDVAELVISIAGSNDDPVAVADDLTTMEDTALTIGTSALTGNDSDPEGSALTVVSVQAASNGTVELASGVVTFTPAARFHGMAGFSYTVADPQGRTVTQQVNIAVSSVNDAPSGAGATLSVLEDGILVLDAGDFGFSDGSDGDALLSVIITALPSAGLLLLGSVAVTQGQEIAAAQLGDLTWMPPAGQNGDGFASIGFKVRDNGGLANGGADTDAIARSITINVTAVNDAPNGAGGVVTVSEDTPYLFSATDFGFSDPDGHQLREVVVTSLPGQGMLRLGTTPVTVNQVIAAADIATLNWTPPLDVSGTGIAAFGFKVRDTGGTAHGGADTDPTAGSISFDIEPDNDAPILTPAGGDGTGLFNLDEGTALVTTLTVSDVDSDTVSLGLTGQDAGRFKLVDGVLSFRRPPDFETPGDLDGDNIYEVTIVALDSGPEFTGTEMDLTVAIHNVVGNRIKGNATGNLLDKTNGLPGGKLATAEEDRIDGKGGNDTIKAGEGNDTLIGGLGNDVLTGGRDADRFVFNTTLGRRNVDLITDFKHDIDVIALDDAIFGAIGKSLSRGEFHAGAGAVAATDRNDRIIYDTSSGKLYYDADGIRAGAPAVHFATLKTKPAGLDHGDFMIV